MVLPSYTRCLVHLVWCTKGRRAVLGDQAARRVTQFIREYAAAKRMYLVALFVNPDHVHVLIDLPIDMSVDTVVHLLKGASALWINRNQIVPARFLWGRGYGAFTVSESQCRKVVAYIARQKELHRYRSFGAELRALIDRHGVRYRDRGPV